MIETLEIFFNIVRRIFFLESRKFPTNKYFFLVKEVFQNKDFSTKMFFHKQKKFSKNKFISLIKKKFFHRQENFP